MVNIRQSWLIFLGRDDAPTRFFFAGSKQPVEEVMQRSPRHRNESRGWTPRRFQRKKKAWTAEIPNEIQLLNLCILKCDVKNMVCFQIITIFNDFYITTIESLLEQFGSKSP